MTNSNDNQCSLCGSSNPQLVKTINSRPAVELDYGIKETDYFREIFKCNNCNVYFNKWEDLIDENFYKGQYNQAIGDGSLIKRFEKITNFPFHKSDNKNRALRVINFLYKQDRKINQLLLLDVGSGTSVFLHEMKKFGLETYSLDPDKNSTEISEKLVKVKQAYTGTFENTNISQTFDLITFNKVLEHVEQPIEILTKSKSYLKPNGIIYVELPDGTDIAKAGRFDSHTEFNVEHLFIFNIESLSYLAKVAGLNILDIRRIKDPSGKHTIYCFLESQTH